MRPIYESSVGPTKKAQNELLGEGATTVNGDIYGATLLEATVTSNLNRSYNSFHLR